MNEYRILVVDDEDDLCEILKFNLEMEGYKVDTANSAEEALKLDLTQYNLLLLDVMMGEISGFKMARMLKANKDTVNIPIIFITAKDTENDTITGFNLGADDYISKPFSLREVIMRVKAVLRRTANLQRKESEELQYKGLVINVPQKKVTIEGEEISLTKKEQRRFNYIRGDSEGFVNIPLSIKNVVFSCFLREDTEKPMIKISLRSVGKFPCNQVASEFFNGGGHLNASGGEFYGTMDEAREVFEAALNKYKPLLTAQP